MSDTSPIPVSVVLPVFMRRAGRTAIRLLHNALESVFNQGYPGPLEIIIIDDGSPDPVQDVMLKHMPETIQSKTHTIRWLRNRRNNGLVSALNTGLRVAQYELIARLDADDRWLDGKLAEQVSRFHADRDLSIVATNAVIIDAKGKEFDRITRADGWGNILRLTTDMGSPFPHGSVLGLRSVFHLLASYSHDPLYAHAEDYHLWAKWVRFFKPAIIEAYLFEYRSTPGSVSQVHRNSQLQASRQIQRWSVVNIDWRNLPGNMRQLAGLLGVSLLQCGAICYRIWRYNPSVAMPREAVNLLQVILPDRHCSIDSNDLDLRQVCQFVDLAEGFPNADGSPATRTHGADDVLVHVR